MNKKILFLGSIFAFAVTQASAQQWGVNSGVPTWTSGNVGVGFSSTTTSNITHPLTVNGDLKFYDVNGADRNIFGTSLSGGLNIFANSSYTNGSAIRLFGSDYSQILPGWHSGGMQLISNVSGEQIAMEFANYNSGNWSSLLSLTANGNFGIGTFPLKKLTVNGDIQLYRDVDSDPREIIAKTNDGVLNILANSNSQDGSGMQFFGQGHANSNSIFFYTPGYSGIGMQVFNYDGVQHNSIYRLHKSGDVQIGSETTDSKLTVSGDISLKKKKDGDVRSIYGRTNTSMLHIASNTTSKDGTAIQLWGKESARPGSISFFSHGISSADHAYDFVLEDDNQNLTWLAWMNKAGQLVIGDVSIPPSGYRYKLYVEDGILTERVKVALSSDPTNWSDFVFDADYKLMPLNEVEDFIAENHHLPEIPSTAEVHKEGLDLAQMDAKLLQKVEELTLYVIQQQKEIDDLKKQIHKK